jgi:hypothetical protein
MISTYLRHSLILVILFSGITVNAQDAGKALTARGYLTTMQSAVFEDFDSEWTNDNLVHNRLNFRLYAGSGLSFGMEMRNRVFTGDMVRLNPEYSDMMNEDNGWLDMSWNVIDKQSLLFNSFIDRLWLDYSGNNFQVRVGRQRINWGQTFVWNPNDVFNAYSYFDFDYPERPGSDAIRLQIFPSYSSTIELAAKLDSDENLSAAALYRFNKWGYDIQFLGGYVSGTDWVVGTGWSGSFGSISFRGEASWFQPNENFSDTTGTGLFTIGFDRSFSNNTMIQFELMYCNSPLDFTDFGSFYNGNLSAKDLAFSKFSLFAAVQIPLTPLLNLGLSSIIYPELNGFFAGPSIDASLSENIDMSFFWQYFKADMAGEESKINLAFLQIKYSF